MDIELRNALDRMDDAIDDAYDCRQRRVNKEYDELDASCDAKWDREALSVIRAALAEFEKKEGA